MPEIFERPFQSTIQNLNGEKVEKIQCPADDDSQGMVELAWLGPKPSVKLFFLMKLYF